MKNKIRYTCQGYKYAPESFKCYMVVIDSARYNHSYYELENFTYEENSKIGTICINKGKRAAEAEIKKIVRGKKESYNYITYGYKSLDGSIISYLQWERIDDEANIKQKLSIYKAIKEYYESHNYIVTEYSYEHCELDGRYSPLNCHREEKRQTLSKKPIKIRFVKGKK